MTATSQSITKACATVNTATMEQCKGVVIGRDHVGLPACAEHCEKKVIPQFDPSYGASERMWTVRVNGKTLLGKGGDKRRFKTASAAQAAGDKQVSP